MKFRLPDSLVLTDLISTLRTAFPMVEEPPISLARSYYDSFDWRLFQAGKVLWRETARRQQRLVLTDTDEEQSGEFQPLSGQMPGFHRELPPGRLREQVAALLDMRVLLPVADVGVTEQIYRVLDEEEKTLLRIATGSYRGTIPGSKGSIPLGGWLRLFPVRGYLKDLDRVQSFLGTEIGLTPASGGILELALTAMGTRPLDYSSKLKFHFSPEERADKAAKKIHLHLLDTLEQNLPGTLADLDSEFLHDLRVAVRRTRSALTQIKGVFEPSAVERFKERLGWVGQITGPTRDMDVYLLDYADYRDSLPERFRKDLEPLHDFLLAHQRQAQRALSRKLRSKAFQELMMDWRTFLEAPVQNSPQGVDGALPIGDVAGKRIYKIFKRVLRQGLAIGADSPPEALHELRKDCKKLRYLIEFFRSLYPQDLIDPVIKTLKALLDNLGDFQDMEVQALKLREFAHEMLREGEVPADTLLAMGMLVDGLLNRQQRARDAFAKRFARFAGKGNRAAFKSLFSENKSSESLA
ncbi:MAG: CHAD domain-containing protein [Gammaproteobacteria bacterium]|nr:CHAD domain-containing protein [Gammaproteobacteria bacterium]